MTSRRCQRLISIKMRTLVLLQLLLLIVLSNIHVCSAVMPRLITKVLPNSLRRQPTAQVRNDLDLAEFRSRLMIGAARKTIEKTFEGEPIDGLDLKDPISESLGKISKISIPVPVLSTASVDPIEKKRKIYTADSLFPELICKEVDLVSYFLTTEEAHVELPSDIEIVLDSGSNDRDWDIATTSLSLSVVGPENCAPKLSPKDLGTVMRLGGSVFVVIFTITDETNVKDFVSIRLQGMGCRYTFTIGSRAYENPKISLQVGDVIPWVN